MEGGKKYRAVKGREMWMAERRGGRDEDGKKWKEGKKWMGG